MKKEEELVKIIIIGDCGVGKTNLLVRFCENTFKMNYIATIGVDFKIKTINVKDTRIKLQIWDTAGQERFKNIAQTYYKGAAGIIMTYSLTEAKTFDSIQRWMIQINEHAPKDVMRMLVANKLDLAEDREVQEREGLALAHKYDIPFIEVSAKEGTNVNDMFNTMGELLVDNYLPNRLADMNAYSFKVLEQAKKDRRKCEC